MSEVYQTEIDGTFDRSAIMNAITAEEAGGAEFTSSEVKIHENKATNMTTFRHGPTPLNGIILMDHDIQKPEGTNQVWTGTMIISGTHKAVSVYRAT